jgi:large subunit ribosomal protein L24e
MVIKYQTCSFSEYKIAPGHGHRYCEVNGKTHIFITKKVHRLFRHSKKPLNIRWTLKWRTSHKKGKVEEAKHRVTKQKKERQIKAIVGLSLEEINRIRESLKDERTNDAQRYKYAQEIKDKKKKYLEKVRKTKGDKPGEKFPKGQKVNVPKGAQAQKGGKK